MANSVVSEQSKLATFGPFSLFPLERKLEKDGVALAIGSRSLEILIALVERAGEAVPNRALISRVWKNVVVEDSSLRVNIAGLRKVLGDGVDGARYVVNIPGQGYSFVAPVQRSAPEAPPDTGTSTAAHQPYDLPRRVQRIVGRDEQVQALTSLTQFHRLLTIVGPGGMGKTTVAVAVAYALQSAFEGEVCFFDLAPLASPLLLASTIAATLGVKLTAGDPFPGLTAWLRNKKILLVLDNCEHLVDSVALLAERLLHAAPCVSILATSREPLRAAGEYAYRLPPLEGPPLSPGLRIDEAMAFPAAQLLVERATANGHHFALADADAPVIAEICRKLDGIALAIELGARRVAAFGVRGTAALLDNRFRLAWGDRRTALPRHQTMGAMLDWSYNLLPEFERMVLRRLSIFAGHFSLDAACKIAGDVEADELDVVQAIDNLVAKSMAAADAGRTCVRYRLAECTRMYAAEKLCASGEAYIIAARHVCYLTGDLEHRQAEFSVLPGPGTDSYTAHIDNLGNLRACLEWSFSPTGDVALGIRLCAAAAPMLLGLSLLDECQRWTKKALSLFDAAGGTAKQEIVLCEAIAISSMFTLGNSCAVFAAIERGLVLAVRLGDRAYELRLLASMHLFQTRSGNHAAALHAAARSKVAARELNDTAELARAEWMLGLSHHIIGSQARAQHHCEAGTALMARAPQRRLHWFGYDHRIGAHVSLSRVLWLRGRADQGRTMAVQVVERAQQSAHPITYCIALVYAASVFLWRGEWDLADELIETLITHACSHMLAPYHAVGKGLKGELLVRRDEAGLGVALLQECIDTLRANKHMVQHSIHVAALAEGLIKLGRLAEALVLVDEALSTNTEVLNTPEMLRIRAEVLRSMPTPDFHAAETSLRCALQRARRQDALAWELRAATTLAGHLSEQGRVGEAHDLLGEIMSRFTEGFDTVDYVAARALLGSLAPA